MAAAVNYCFRLFFLKMLSTHGFKRWSTASAKQAVHFSCSCFFPRGVSVCGICNFQWEHLQ
jgi:hypothetical protein